jgi:hypothetical protein
LARAVPGMKRQQTQPTRARPGPSRRSVRPRRGKT